MNLLEVGALLKTERERRGISIRDVMDATKISRRNLTALEEGQIKSLPHPVYLKGYVRNIARMVGLDADELAQVVDQQFDAEAGRYLPQAPAAAPVLAQASAPVQAPAPAPASAAEPALSGPEQQPAQPARRPAPEPEREPRQHFTPEPLVPPKPKYSGTWRSVLALVLLAAALVFLLVQYQRMSAEAPPAPAPVAAPADNATTAPALDNATANATDLDNATAEVLPPAAALPAVQPGPEPAAAPGAPVSSIEVTRSKAAAPVPAPAPAPVPAIEKRTPGAQVLTITAKGREACWVGVFEGEKRTTFTLRDGESRQVEFVKRASLRLGNAGGVTVRLNGQDYPFEGDRGQKVTLEFGTR